MILETASSDGYHGCYELHKFDGLVLSGGSRSGHALSNFDKLKVAGRNWRWPYLD
jgi:hypothetical protein